jgi:hypothetical protein
MGFLNMSWMPERSYNQLPPLPPDTALVETRKVLKACIKARAALAELNTSGELLPDQRLLINLLPMLEAKDSLALKILSQPAISFSNTPIVWKVLTLQQKKRYVIALRCIKALIFYRTTRCVLAQLWKSAQR